MEISQRMDFFLEIDFDMNKTLHQHWRSYHILMRNILIHYGLSSRKRPPPLSDQLHLTFWVVAYRGLDCINNINMKKLARKKCRKRSSRKHF